MPFNTTFDVNPASQAQFAKDEADRLALPALVPSYPYHGYANVALAGGVGEVADLPGPATGYIRIYGSCHAVSSTLGTGLTSITFTLRPSDLLLSAAQSGTATLTLSAPPPLGVGETIRVTNGGAGAGRVAATYIDVPATGITLIRTQLDATGVTVVPAAPTGYVNRLLQPLQVGSQGIVLRTWNADAVTQSIEVLIGSTLVSRAAPALTLAVGSINGPTLMPITTDPMVMRTAAAINTTGPWFIWAYETMPVLA